ncbi:MAG: hypothetical protein EPO12_09910 [Aquabacterium sp.]|jgi:succinoglycan biosynthesis transport protein ExoP|nr:MAG: hypothetical protein EPO12_09910 [Aquabacterium sp.]
MSFQRFLLVLRARWGVALLVAVATIAACVGGTLRSGELYKATASVMLDLSGRSALTKVLTAKDVATPSLMRRFDPSELPDANAGLAHKSAQFALITSDEVVRRAVKTLGLGELPDLHATWYEDTGGVGDINSWLAERVRGAVEPSLSPRSSIIQISYYAAEPKFAAAMANAIVDSYLKIYGELREQIQKPKLQALARRVDDSRARLDKAWAALREFQARNSVIALTDLLEPTTRREFARLRRMNLQMEMGRDAAIARSAAIARNPGLAPSPSSMNPAVDAALLSWTEARAEFAAQSQRLGKDHPAVRQMEASLAERERETAREIERLADVARADADVSRETSARTNERYTSQVDAARNRLPLQVEARSLVQAVLNAFALNTIAQDSFHAGVSEAVLERYKVTLLDVATAPASRYAPDWLVLVPVILIVALALSASTVLVLELVDPHVRQPESLQSAGLALLGSIGDSTLEDHPQIAWAQAQGRA